MFKNMIACATVALSLSACVSHTWAPGPTQNAGNFGQVSGQCKLLALNGGGAPQFVGAVASLTVVSAPVVQGYSPVGSFADGFTSSGGAAAIATAVKRNQVYNACMEANGFVAVDKASQS